MPASRGGPGGWLVVVLLLAGVLVPTACVLWFLSQAVRNEHLAIRQKLTDVYRGQLDQVTPCLRAWWKDRRHDLDAVRPAGQTPVTLAKLARDAGFDALVIPARVDGPIHSSIEIVSSGDPGAAAALQKAQGLELESADLAAALRGYQAIAANAIDPDVHAQALLGVGRCLLKLGERDKALPVFFVELQQFPEACDRQGRLIAANGLLLFLEGASDRHADGPQRVRARLTVLLTDPSSPRMPAAQRCFLMHEICCLMGDTGLFPSLAAEELALAYVEAGGVPAPGREPTPTPLAGVWQLASADASVVGLLREGRMIADVESALRTHLHWSDATAKLIPPKAAQDGSPAAFITAPSDDFLPGWRLGVYLLGPDPFATAAHRAVSVYIWTALLGVAAIILVAGLAGYFVRRQVHLARLKNDLIATVSHELKTPLASMRVLVDTLLAGHPLDAQQVRTYHQLIARENQRLSRLIDNFLTFSRMERHKHVFEREVVDLRAVVEEGVASVHDRFGPDSALSVEVAPNVPRVSGDKDALVTVLLNLLDNAHKYSGDPKRVRVRAFQSDGQAVLEVSDDGIGIPRRAQRRIFDRFYQVDRRLSRIAGGCGLGLSIVQFIVAAHAGTIRVRSEVGRGSTFTVTLPAAVEEQAHGR